MTTKIVYPLSLAYKIRLISNNIDNISYNITHAFRGNIKINEMDIIKNAIIYIKKSYEDERKNEISYDYDHFSYLVNKKFEYISNTPEPKEFFRKIKLISGHKIVIKL